MKSSEKNRNGPSSELEENQEGLTDGVRQVLDLAQQADAGPFSLPCVPSWRGRGTVAGGPQLSSIRWAA